MMAIPRCTDRVARQQHAFSTEQLHGTRIGRQLAFPRSNLSALFSLLLFLLFFLVFKLLAFLLAMPLAFLPYSRLPISLQKGHAV